MHSATTDSDQGEMSDENSDEDVDQVSKTSHSDNSDDISTPMPGLDDRTKKFPVEVQDHSLDQPWPHPPEYYKRYAPQTVSSEFPQHNLEPPPPPKGANYFVFSMLDSVCGVKISCLSLVSRDYFLLVDID